MNPHYRPTQLRILIVSHDRQWRALLRAQLSLYGTSHISEAANGEEAVSEIRSFRPGIVISTLTIQPYDGIALALYLRRAEDSPHPYIPIVLILTPAQQSRVVDARNAGINAVLMSPVSGDAMQAHLKEIIENPRPFIRAGNYFGPDRRMRPRVAVSATL